MYLDFNRAFDIGLHYCLINKFKKYCLKEIIVRWVQNHLERFVLVVVANGSTSGWKDKLRRVPL